MKINIVYFLVFLCSLQLHASEVSKEFQGFIEALSHQKLYAAKEGSGSILKSIVLIKGDKGVGTGFFADFHGKKYIVSNRHVLYGNKEITMETYNGTPIPFGNLIVGCKPKLDLVFYLVNDEVKKRYSFIPISSTASLGEELKVYGNSLGEDLITELSGKLKAVGPTQIEISNEIVPGNSGSPVINDKGQCVGVATYIKRQAKNWTVDGTEFAKPRRFALRFNRLSALDFEEMTFVRYQKELFPIQAFENYVTDVTDKFIKAQEEDVLIRDFLKDNKKLFSNLKRGYTFCKKKKFSRWFEMKKEGLLEVSDSAFKAVNQLKKSKKSYDAGKKELEGYEERIEKYKKYAHLFKMQYYLKEVFATKANIIFNGMYIGSRRVESITVQATVWEKETGKIIVKDKKIVLTSGMGVDPISFNPGSGFIKKLASIKKVAGKKYMVLGGIVAIRYK